MVVSLEVAIFYCVALGSTMIVVVHKLGSDIRGRGAWMCFSGEWSSSFPELCIGIILDVQCLIMYVPYFCLEDLALSPTHSNTVVSPKVAIFHCLALRSTMMALALSPKMAS